MKVAVVGGGWAGLSAAVRLCDAGCAVTLFEASRQLGGRARRVDWTLPDGRRQQLDNGQHILLGAYSATLDLMKRVGVDPEGVLMRRPFFLESTGPFRLSAPAIPAPWHMLIALLGAKGLPWPARLAMLALIQHSKRCKWKLAQDVCVADWLISQNQPEVLCRLVWNPLCVAALNTPPGIASAQVFLNVLRDSVGAGRAASDMLLPRVALDALLPEAASNYVNRRGRVLLGERVTHMQVHADTVQLGFSTIAQFDAAVLAVPAPQCATLLGDDLAFATIRASCEAITWQPIVTAYLLYPERLKMRAPMMALAEDANAGRYGQWLFDKGILGDLSGMAAVVISAAGAHRDMDADALLDSVERQLRDELGWVTAPIARRLITEKRATFACVPGMSRPGTRTPSRRLALAGDYTASDYPATLETAVRSGQAAAQVLLEGI